MRRKATLRNSGDIVLEQRCRRPRKVVSRTARRGRRITGAPARTSPSQWGDVRMHATATGIGACEPLGSLGLLVSAAVADQYHICVLSFDEADPRVVAEKSLGETA